MIKKLFGYRKRLQIVRNAIEAKFQKWKNSSKRIGMNRFFQTSETQTGRIISIVVIYLFSIKCS